MRILEHCFRVHADPDHFDEAIAFYEALQGVACARRLTIAETGVRVARIGGVLLLSGTEEQLAPARPVAAIFYVDALDEAAAWLTARGAGILRAPRAVTGGANLLARHPDGLVVEYFEAASARRQGQSS
ncbi:hypothetical protein FDP22_12270 [Paroceanicella profunda]|uniref:VOC family protein n=1 Tax=Paroceanicella profunda TaxID=2579971 RepID=A0A5B8FHR1_9RHOB|nr:hypothetical protein [Paroceanicella profunda]QDL92487.1 hypothetical protein FDP22_12270 [Paroceanicella profunda]